jgi:hypothetical protein
MASERRKPKRGGGRRAPRSEKAKELAEFRARVRRMASVLRTKTRKAQKASDRQAADFKARLEDMKKVADAILAPGSLVMRNC